MANYCTLSDVKYWLNIDQNNTNSDPLLTTLIASASAYIDNWTNRQFSQASVSYTANGTGSAILIVKDFPITSISSLTVDSQAIPLSDGKSFGYLYDDKIIYLIGTKFTKGFQNVTVALTYGYAVIPNDIKQVCIELVGYKYKERERIGIASKTLAGEVISFDIKDLKEHNKNILNNYNRVVPL